MWRRLKPVFSLVLLAPLIAEYLLGSLTFGQLVLFPIMVLIYGGGALFVREITRHSGRGWPTIVVLGLAYGVIEEGLATQSLFNPHYLGLRLLDHGFIPALGIGAPWTVYVIILHAAWSVAAPIGLVEALNPAQRLIPWLQKPGLIASGFVYLLGVALVTFGTFKKEQFAASFPQLSVTACIAVFLIASAFLFFRRMNDASDEKRDESKWTPLRLGALSFIAGSGFHLIAQFGAGFQWPALAVGIALLFPLIVIAAVHAGTKSGAWTFAHTDALMIGGLLAYCWLGFFLTARLHGVQTIPGQVFPCAIVLTLLFRVFLRYGNKGKIPETGLSS